MKLTKMIYIASPYTCKDNNTTLKYKKKIQLNRYENATKAIGVLQDKYSYAFIGPITQSHNTVEYMKNIQTTFDHWKLRDLTYISRCDEVWVLKLPGWDKSTGVFEEIKFAVLNQIKVKFINPKTLKVFNDKKVIDALFVHCFNNVLCSTA